MLHFIFPAFPFAFITDFVLSLCVSNRIYLSVIINYLSVIILLSKSDNTLSRLDNMKRYVFREYEICREI